MTREELLKAIITELQKGKIKDFNEHVQEALREQMLLINGHRAKRLFPKC